MDLDSELSTYAYLARRRSEASTARRGGRLSRERRLSRRAEKATEAARVAASRSV